MTQTHNIIDIQKFYRDGFCIYKSLVGVEQCCRLISAIESAGVQACTSGVRNLEKKVKEVSELVQSPEILGLAEKILNDKPKMVRAIYFNKTPEANWGVVWHQDKTIAVDAKLDINGWGPWTVKDGMHHVQPDIEVLEKMVTFRIHLDAANEDNGCLKVIPQSHRFGVLLQKQVDELKNSDDSVSCLVRQGDAVIMRPHLLHSSNKAKNPTQRRVIHLEYSSYSLPDGLNWA